METHSLVKVRCDKIKRICQLTQMRIIKERGVLYDEAITDAMVYSWFWVRKTRSRGEAKTYVDNWKKRGEYIWHGIFDEEIAVELTNMCDISCEDYIYLSVEHVQFLTTNSRDLMTSKDKNGK